jgi:hypothetical protein
LTVPLCFREVYARCRKYGIPVPVNIDCNRIEGVPLEFEEEVSAQGWGRARG